MMQLSSITVKLTNEQLIALRTLPADAAPNRLRVALAMLRMTQRAFAKEHGFHEPDISDIALGKYTDLMLSTVQRVSFALGATVDDIFPAAVRKTVSL